MIRGHSKVWLVKIWIYTFTERNIFIVFLFLLQFYMWSITPVHITFTWFKIPSDFSKSSFIYSNGSGRCRSPYSVQQAYQFGFLNATSGKAASSDVKTVTWEVSWASFGFQSCTRSYFPLCSFEVLLQVEADGGHKHHLMSSCFAYYSYLSHSIVLDQAPKDGLHPALAQSFHLFSPPAVLSDVSFPVLLMIGRSYNLLTSCFWSTTSL